MDKLAEIFRINRQLDSEYEAAAALIQDKAVIRSLRFLTEMDALAAKYQFAPKDILLLLCPELAESELDSLSVTSTLPSQSTPSDKGGKNSRRAVRRYLNPHTGEILETRGTNNKQLKLWKAQHGGGTVESWRQSEL